MQLNRLSARHLDIIRRFVGSDEFADIKDGFVSHTPEGGIDGNRGEGDSKNLGKFLGTRYVFNKLEELAAITIPPQEETRKQKQGRTSSKDPDLDE